MDDLYLLEFSIHHKEGQKYAIDPRLFGPDKQPCERPYSGSGSPTMILDSHGLLSRRSDPLAYGTYLQQLFFADNRVGESLHTAQAKAAATNALLRLRLRLELNDAALHQVCWELLRDPSGSAFLAMQERTLFSRYYDPSQAPRIERRQTARPQALLAVASPIDLATYGLTQIEVDSEVGRVVQALQDTDIIRLAYPLTESRATFARLAEYMRSQLDIVYLVCHGTICSEDGDKDAGETVLFLEAEDGYCHPVSGRMLVESLSGVVHWPTLLILVACQTAGSGTPEEMPLVALGPQLIAAGCPALLVLNGNMSVQTAESFFPTFFRQLHDHGYLELALATARAACRSLDDWWRPVLYTRLADGRVWEPASPPQVYAGIPDLPPYHITRIDEENQVVQLLTRNGMPFINMYGLPGTGKTALIASVIRRRYAELGVDGVLWGDMGRLTPAEQLWEFLHTLMSPTAIAPERVDLLRKLFWKQVEQKHLRLIIVLDNVTTPQATTDLLPLDGEIPPGCRILLISLEELRLLPYGRLPCLPVRMFDTDQTRRLFIEVLGEQVVNHYAEDLARMGQALGGLPHLVTMAALQLRSVNLRTDELHDEIAAYLQQTSLRDPGYGERLELALRHLTDSQLAILELTGIMGEGDWPATLVAAACLRSQTDVTADLDALVDRGIIMRLPFGRYNTNRLIRSYAQTRLFEQPVARHHATLYLLARACLDIAEDCYMSALEQSEIFTPSVPVTDRVAVVQQVRRRLLPEIAHIRQALHWAEQYSNWRLIERFARLAWFELLDNLVVNTREVTGALLLATLYQPVFWYAGPLVQVYGQSGIVSQPLRFAHPGIADCLEISDAFAYTNHLQWPKLSRDVPHDHSDAVAPELNVHLIASRIIDGIISGYTLVETRWIGVVAEGLILYGVDLGGAHWMSCLMRNSLLHDCNAHHAELHNIDLQQSILEKVQLRGARLTNIDLRGAQLTQVDLRGAQLTNVDLRGASLDTVNLRGASLTGVRFDGATLNAVAIHRVQLQSSTWYGVTGLPESENVPIVNAISNQARERHVEIRDLQPPTRLCADDILAVPTRDFHQQDLRGITLSGQTLVVPPPEHPGFTEARLDVAQLQGAVLLQAKMTKASLRAANLTRADLSGADLRMANLQAVLAEACDLRLADLRGASLRGARLRGVNLSKACLAQADLSGADLREADLSGADLSEALLVGADLRDATVDDVTLARASNLSRTLLTVCSNVYRVPEFRGVYREMEEGFSQHAFLRFAMCSGTFVQVGFAERDLFGSQLTGIFQDLVMQRSDLRHARLSNSFTRVCLCDSNLEQATLSGIFSQCGFQRAHMRGARLEGTWSRASFQHADLCDTDWTGASLVEVDLRGAQGVTSQQLQQALRLRGTILPDGQCFVSPQGLPGDRDDARQWGYDPDDPEAMWAFYRASCKNL